MFPGKILCMQFRWMNIGHIFWVPFKCNYEWGSSALHMILIKFGQFNQLWLRHRCDTIAIGQHTINLHRQKRRLCNRWKRSLETMSNTVGNCRLRKTERREKWEKHLQITFDSQSVNKLKWIPSLLRGTQSTSRFFSRLSARCPPAQSPIVNLLARMKRN